MQQIPGLFKPPQCFLLGTCTCKDGPAGTLSWQFFTKLKQWLRTNFAKVHKKAKSEARLLLDQQRIVLRFTPVAPMQPDVPHGEDPPACEPELPEPVFVHMAYINYQSFHFAVLSLSSDMAWLGYPSLQDQPILQVGVPSEVLTGPSCGVQTELDFIEAALDLKFAWTLSVFVISTEEAHWQKIDTSACVLPLLELPASALHSGGSFMIWRGATYEKFCQARAHAGSKRKPPATAKAKSAGDAGATRRRMTKKAPEAGRESLSGPTLPGEDDALELLEQSDPYGVGVHDRAADEAQDEDEDPDDWQAQLDRLFDAIDAPAGESELSDDPEFAAPGAGEDGWDEASDDDDADDPYAGFPQDLLDRLGVTEEMRGTSSRRKTARGIASTDAPAASSAAKDSRTAEDEVISDRAEPSSSSAGPAAVADAKQPETEHGRAGAAEVVRATTGRRPDFSKNEFDVGEVGKLRWYHHLKQLQAVCNHPDHKDCRMTRTVQEHPRAASGAAKSGTVAYGQGRPLGLLVSEPSMIMGHRRIPCIFSGHRLQVEMKLVTGSWTRCCRKMQHSSKPWSDCCVLESLMSLCRSSSVPPQPPQPPSLVLDSRPQQLSVISITSASKITLKLMGVGVI